MMRLGPPASECRIFTFREGILSSFGHDLELVVARFDVQVDEKRRRVDASFDAASLRVVRALRDGVEIPNAPSADERRQIEDNARRDVLDANRFPEIRFRSTRVADVEGGYDVTGTLQLHGKERELVVALRRAGDRYVADVPIEQPDFGIRPYSAFLGALKVKPRVVVRVSFPPPG
jgi:polyisoprenoid-binding protein YceI